MIIDEGDPRLSPSERSWLRALLKRVSRPLAATYERPKRTDTIPSGLRQGWEQMYCRPGDVDAAESLLIFHHTCDGSGRARPFWNLGRPGAKGGRFSLTCFPRRSILQPDTRSGR